MEGREADEERAQAQSAESLQHLPSPLRVPGPPAIGFHVVKTETSLVQTFYQAGEQVLVQEGLPASDMEPGGGGTVGEKVEYRQGVSRITGAAVPPVGPAAVEAVAAA